MLKIYELEEISKEDHGINLDNWFDNEGFNIRLVNRSNIDVITIIGTKIRIAEKSKKINDDKRILMLEEYDGWKHIIKEGNDYTGRSIGEVY